MSRFDFALRHVVGKSMGRADSLSRRVDWAEGVEKDNKNQVMVKEEWLEVRVMERLIEGPEEEIIKRIKEVRDKNEKVIKVVEEMKRAGVKTIRGGMADRGRIGVKRRKSVCTEGQEVKSRDYLAAS